MKKLLASRSLFAVMVLVTVVLASACRGANPTSTPVPPTVQFPTPLPPAPTAPPLTEAPTAVVPTGIPGAATATPGGALATATTAAPEPTSTTASSTTTQSTNPTRTTVKTTGGVPPSQQGPLQGLYVAGIRYDPTYPQNQAPVTFYVTIVNRNSREQNYPICVEIFHPDAPKSFGISNCNTVNLPVGTHEVLAGSWIASGIKYCIPVRARAVLHELDTDNVRLPLVTLQGGDLWQDFNVCP